MGENSKVVKSIVSEGSEIYGEVYNSVIGPDVIINENAVIKDSIIMSSTVIGEGSYIERCILDENCIVGNNVTIGSGDNIPNEVKPKIYYSGITVVGEGSKIPDGVDIGKNCVIYGVSKIEDYPENKLDSGKSLLVKGGSL